MSQRIKWIHDKSSSQKTNLQVHGRKAGAVLPRALSLAPLYLGFFSLGLGYYAAIDHRIVAILGPFLCLLFFLLGLVVVIKCVQETK